MFRQAVLGGLQGIGIERSQGAAGTGSQDKSKDGDE